MFCMVGSSLHILSLILGLLLTIFLKSSDLRNSFRQEASFWSVVPFNEFVITTYLFCVNYNERNCSYIRKAFKKLFARKIFSYLLLYILFSFICKQVFRLYTKRTVIFGIDQNISTHLCLPLNKSRMMHALDLHIPRWHGL